MICMFPSSCTLSSRCHPFHEYLAYRFKLFNKSILVLDLALVLDYKFVQLLRGLGVHFITVIWGLMSWNPHQQSAPKFTFLHPVYILVLLFIYLQMSPNTYLIWHYRACMNVLGVETHWQYIIDRIRRAIISLANPP